MASPNITLENFIRYLNILFDTGTPQERKFTVQKIPLTNNKNAPFLENLFSKSNDVFFHPLSGFKLLCKENLSDAISLQCISNTNLPNFQVSGNYKHNNIHAVLGIYPDVQLDIQSKLNLKNSICWSFRGHLDFEKGIDNLETCMVYSKNDFSTRLTLARTDRKKPPQKQNGYFDFDIDKNLSGTSFSLQLVKRLNNCWMLGVHLGNTTRFGICRQFQKSEVGVLADENKYKLFYHKNIMQDLHIGIQYLEFIDPKKSVIKIGIKADTENGEWRCFLSTEGILGLYYQTKISNFGIKLSCLLRNGYPKLGCGLKISC